MKIIVKKQIFEQYKSHELEDGLTLGQMLDAVSIPKEVHEYIQIRINGQLINKKYWYHARPNENTNISIALIPAGGDSNDLFRTAVQLAVIAAAASVAPQAAVAKFAFMAAASMVANQVATSMFPPTLPEGPNDPGTGNKLNVVTGQSNRADPNGVVIRNYGTNRVFPRLIAQPYTYQVGKDQYIVSLYDFGSGRQHIEDGEIKIGDTSLSFYKDVTKNIAYNASELKLYQNRVNTVFPNFKFEDENDVFVQTTPENTDSIGITLSWPSGLVGYYGRKNKSIAITQRIRIEYRPIDSTLWRNAAWADLDLDPGIKIENKTNLKVIVLPTIGTGGNAAYNPPQVVSTYTYRDPFYFGFGLAPTKTGNIYNFEFNSDEIWYRPIENDENVSLGTNFTSRLLIKDDVIEIGGRKHFIDNPNIGTFVLDGKTYYKASIRVPRNYGGTTQGFYRYAIYNTNLKNNIGWINTASGIYSNKGIYVSGYAVNQDFIVTKRTLDEFKIQLKINPNEGPKQFEVRVRYADYSSSLQNSNIKTLISDFYWEQLKGFSKSAPVLTDKEHTYLELKVKASDEINGNLDTLSSVISSYLPVYDPVNEVWKEEISNNPAWVFASILTNNSNQRAISFDQLDVDSLVVWANYCETNTIYLQSNLIGFECNFVLENGITLKDLLDKVCATGRATLNVNNGKYGVIIDEYKTTPTQMFNPRNIISMEVSRSYVKTANALRVKYVDPFSNWQENTVIAYDDGYDANNADVIEEISGFGITNMAQAWRQGRYFLAQHKLRKDIVTIQVDFESLACSRGDLVYFSHDVMRNGGTPARIKSIDGNVITIDELAVDQGGNQVVTVRNRLTNTIENYNIVSFVSDYQIELDSITNIQTGDLCVYGVEDQVIRKYIVKAIRYSDDIKAEIELIEYNENIYTADSGDLPDYSVIGIPSVISKQFIPGPVENLSYSYTINAIQSEKRYIYIIDLTWDVPNIGKSKLFEIYKIVNGETKLIGYSDSTTFRHEIPGSQLDLEHIFKVVGVSNLGDKINLAEASFFTFTPYDDQVAPENVDNFNANVLTDVIELDWTQNADLDIDKYLIRFSTNTSTASWPQSTPIAGAAANQTSISVPLRTGTYLIRARDYAGNLSPQASKIVTSVPEISKIEFISNVSAPNWVGNFFNSELLGSSLLLKSNDNYQAFPNDVGDFYFEEVFDLGDIFTARFIADVVASGFSTTGLMANWNTLAEIDPIAGTFNDDDFDASAYIRTRNEPDVMANWTPLSSVDYLSFGSELTATPWVKFKAGDFTGRIFQLRIRLESGDITVSPIVYSANIDAHWNERIIQGRDIQSGEEVIFDGAFVELPAIQVTSQENVQNGDYFLFTNKTVEGFTIQFYDVNDNPVSDRRFDWIAKGIGKKYTLEDINF